MAEHLFVEKPFCDQFAALGWKVTGQGQSIIPVDPDAITDLEGAA